MGTGKLARGAGEARPFLCGDGGVGDSRPFETWFWRAPRFCQDGREPPERRGVFNGSGNDGEGARFCQEGRTSDCPRLLLDPLTSDRSSKDLASLDLTGKLCRWLGSGLFIGSSARLLKVARKFLTLYTLGGVSITASPFVLLTSSAGLSSSVSSEACGTEDRLEVLGRLPGGS